MGATSVLMRHATVYRQLQTNAGRSTGMPLFTGNCKQMRAGAQECVRAAELMAFKANIANKQTIMGQFLLGDSFF
jgi:hypothetical protein